MHRPGGYRVTPMSQPHPILQEFDYRRDRVEVQRVCQPFAELATRIDARLPEGREKDHALQHLRNAMHTVVRAITR